MKRPSPYLRMHVLGAVECAEGKTKRQQIKNAAKLTYVDEFGNQFKFTWRTISTWYYRKKLCGTIAIENKQRSNTGKTRKTSPEEVLEAINEAKNHFKPNIVPPKSQLYRVCIEQGLLRAEQIARTTFYRMIREFDLLDQEEDQSIRRLAFAMPHANDLWQVDTMFGPYVDHGGKKVQSKLIAFIDDASRVVCHGQFFPTENINALIETLRNAMFKRGIPKAIYADNGAIYSCAEIHLICARLGCTLRHTPLRDGASKGKIERFFRTVREQFLIRNLDLSSLKSLNAQFWDWVENQYNDKEHSILKMAPLDRHFLDRKLLTFLPPSEDVDELFYMEDTRKVGNDNTFRFDSKRFETPVQLAGKTIVIRYPRLEKDRVIVYYKNDRMGEAKIVDFIANSQAHRPGRSKKT